jgi:hypothetical protein
MTIFFGWTSVKWWLAEEEKNWWEEIVGGRGFWVRAW